MSRWATGALIGFIAACSSSGETVSTGIAIENVTVIDVEDGSRTEGVTVVVQANRIASIGPSAEVTLGENVERVSGTGRFLIPGLWDMHAHVMSAAGAVPGLELFIANGVTSVREMWGAVEAGARITDEVRVGERVGPRLVVPGNIVDGLPTWWPGSQGAGTPAAGIALVDSLAEAGAAFIKVYSLLEPDVYRAILEQASVRGLPVAGHVPFSVSAREASEAGQVSMAHTFGLPEGCSSVEADVRATRAGWLAERAAGTQSDNPYFDPGLYRQLMDEFDEALCDALLEELARNETWQVPTLTVNRSMAFTTDPAMTEDPRLEYVPETTRAGWEGLSAFKATTSAADQETERAFFRHQVDMVRRAHAADVPILAGTDTPNPYVFPGFSLHDELELLLSADLTPLEVLQTATVEPARFLGAIDSLGTVDVGKIADLVLLEGDPLEDIGNTVRIAAVVAGGRLFDREALDGLLQSAKETAGN